MCCRLLRISTFKTGQMHRPTPGCIHLSAGYHLPSPRDSRQTEESPVSFFPQILQICVSHCHHPRIRPPKSLTQVLGSNLHPTPGLPTTNRVNVLGCKLDCATTLQGHPTWYKPCLFSYGPQLPALGLRAHFQPGGKQRGRDPSLCDGSSPVSLLLPLLPPGHSSQRFPYIWL